MAPQTNISLKELQKKDFSLVLSGGSAFGLAHIGILDSLYKRHITPKEIIGTSMGAIIAAFYAFGKSPAEIFEIMNEVNFLTLIRPTFNSGALLKHKAIHKKLQSFLGDITISMLPISLKVTSTDATTGEPIVFDEKSPEKLVDILCTSFSIPFIFPPYQLEGKYYYDGFLSSNLPLDHAQEKLIIAVNVLNSSVLENYTGSSIASVLKKSFIISLLNQSRLQYSIASKKKIISIEPILNHFDFIDFSKVDAFSQAGKEAFEALII